jgi:hypothetical protein
MLTAFPETDTADHVTVVGEGFAAGEHQIGDPAWTPTQSLAFKPDVAAKLEIAQVPMPETAVPVVPNFTVPATSSLALGLVVPIPTLPAESMRMASAEEVGCETSVEVLNVIVVGPFKVPVVTPRPNIKVFVVLFASKLMKATLYFEVS